MLSVRLRNLGSRSLLHRQWRNFSVVQEDRRSTVVASPVASSSAPSSQEKEKNYNIQMLKLLAKHLWPDERNPDSLKIKSRVVGSLGLMVASKIVTIQVPFIFKDIIDSFNVADASAPMLPVAMMIG